MCTHGKGNETSLVTFNVKVTVETVNFKVTLVMVNFLPFLFTVWADFIKYFLDHVLIIVYSRCASPLYTCKNLTLDHIKITIKGVAHRKRSYTIRSDKIYRPCCFFVMYAHILRSYQIRHCKTRPDISKLEKFPIFMLSWGGGKGGGLSIGCINERHSITQSSIFFTLR